MKTDSQLQHDVMEELRWDPMVDHTEIGVSASAGVVTLSGIVHSFSQKDAAERATKRVRGVKAIAEELTVRLPRQRQNADAEIAKRITDMLGWNTLVPDDCVQVKVEKGYVTLTGCVDWNYQSIAARDAVAKISGVVGIRNEIQIKATPASGDVRQLIEEAIKRLAALDAAEIEVKAEGHKVRLYGRVHSWAERRAAENAAWSAAGVNEVVNNIVVTV